VGNQIFRSSLPCHPAEDSLISAQPNAPNHVRSTATEIKKTSEQRCPKRRIIIPNNPTRGVWIFHFKSYISKQ